MSDKLQKTHLIMQSYHNPMAQVNEPSICQRQIEGHRRQNVQQNSILLPKRSYLLMMTSLNSYIPNHSAPPSKTPNALTIPTSLPTSSVWLCRTLGIISKNYSMPNFLKKILFLRFAFTTKV